MLTRKKIYLSYSNDRENRINEIINEIDPFNKIQRMDTIKESEITLIFLTNKYLALEKFKEDYEAARTENKTIIFILLENCLPLIDLNDFKTIKLNEFYTEAIKKLKIFTNPENIVKQSITSRLISIKNSNIITFEIFEIVSKNQLIFKSIGKKLKVYNFETSKIIEVNYKYLRTRISCWIQDLQQMFDVEKINESDRLNYKYYAVDGNCLRNDYLLVESKGFQVKSIKYNADIQYLFLHIFYYMSNFKEIISVYNNNLKILFNIENFSIYNLPYNYSNTIRFQNCDFEIFYDYYNTNNDILVVLQDKIKKVILIFDLNSFSVIGSMESSYKVLIVVNNKIIFGDDEGNYFIYRIEFKKSSSSINSKYICKLNPFKPHLYTNPYLLPCNNSACWECICYHYDIHKGVFKCNFDDCKDEHKLPQILNPNLQLKKIMEDDCAEILKIFFESEKNYKGWSAKQKQFCLLFKLTIF